MGKTLGVLAKLLNLLGDVAIVALAIPVMLDVPPLGVARRAALHFLTLRLIHALPDRFGGSGVPYFVPCAPAFA